MLLESRRVDLPVTTPGKWKQSQRCRGNVLPCLVQIRNRPVTEKQSRDKIKFTFSRQALFWFNLLEIFPLLIRELLNIR